MLLQNEVNTLNMYGGDVGIAEQQKVRKQAGMIWHKTVQYTAPYILLSLYSTGVTTVHV